MSRGEAFGDGTACKVRVDIESGLAPGLCRLVGGGKVVSEDARAIPVSVRLGRMTINRVLRLRRQTLCLEALSRSRRAEHGLPASAPPSIDRPRRHAAGALDADHRCQITAEALGFGAHVVVPGCSRGAP